MTNKEAIHKLIMFRRILEKGVFPVGYRFDAEPFDMAVEALEKQEAKKPDMIWDTTFGKIRPHCLVCGASNPTGANYCWNCGQRFISEEES